MLREKKPIRSYHGEQFRTNPTNKKHLAEDFGHRCAYCDDLDTYGGGYRAYHVEHFAPKEKFPALRVRLRQFALCVSLVQPSQVGYMAK